MTEEVQAEAREALLRKITEQASAPGNAQTIERLARAYHHVVSAGEDGTPSVFFLPE